MGDSRTTASVSIGKPWRAKSSVIFSTVRSSPTEQPRRSEGIRVFSTSLRRATTWLRRFSHSDSSRSCRGTARSSRPSMV